MANKSKKKDINLATNRWMSIGVYASIAAALGVSGFAIYNTVFAEEIARKKAEKVLGKPVSYPSANTGNSTSSTLPKPSITEAFPLKIGDKNQYVHHIQNAILAMGGTAANYIESSGGADGIYGQGLKSALLNANFINAAEWIYKGDRYTHISRELYNKITNYGLGALHNPSGKLATTNKNTWIIDDKGLTYSPAKGIWAKKGTVLGYYVTESDGLAKVLHKSGKHVYTPISNLTII